jgi:hypothetical protein
MRHGKKDERLLLHANHTCTFKWVARMSTTWVLSHSLSLCLSVSLSGYIHMPCI